MHRMSQFREKTRRKISILNNIQFHSLAMWIAGIQNRLVDTTSHLAGATGAATTGAGAVTTGGAATTGAAAVTGAGAGAGVGAGVGGV